MGTPLYEISDLRKAGRDLAVPFEIGLESGKRLLIEKILRLLPGKRITAQARLDDRTVLAKIFFARSGARRHMRSEKKGLLLLKSSRLPAPDLLGSCDLEGNGCLLLIEFLSPSESVRERWRTVYHKKTACPAQMAVLEPLFAYVGAMHAAGLCQKDLHLGNFLLHEGTLKVVDGDAIATCHGLRQKTANLGLLLAQFPLALVAFSSTLLTAYRQGDGSTRITPEQLTHAAQKQHNKRVRCYLAKTLRDCTEFCVKKTSHHFSSMVRSSSPWLAELLVDPDKVMVRGEPLKLGRSSTVVRLVLNGHSVVVKRYNTVSAWRYLKRCWRSSRAMKSWLNGHRLRSLGIVTPQPLAMIEERRGLLRGRAWLVTEYIEGDHILHLLTQHHGKEFPHNMKEALGELFGNLYRAGISHGDMKGTNLLWHDGRIWLIDLDAMRVHRNRITFKRAWKKDHQRFLRNWRDRSAFPSCFNDLFSG